MSNAVVTVPSSSSSSTQPHVLLVGAGCTGALVAAFLRQEAYRRGQQIQKLCVWEWGRGPAGRMSSFWVDVDGEQILADVGAQVISLRSVGRLPSWLKEHVLPAEPAGLARTDERFEDWHHFFAPAGLPALQRASLAEARPEEVHFNRRLLELCAGSSRCWRAGYAGERGGRKPVGFQEFDMVIFAGTASDASNLDGLRAALAPGQLRALNSVAYDHRVCIALILKADLARHIERLCQGCAELSLDDSGPIGLISRQEVKGRASPMHGCPFAIVVHSTPAFALRNLQNAKSLARPPSETGKQGLLECFASLLSVSTQFLQSKVLDCKTVHWRQCQVRKAFAHGSQSLPCLIAGAASHLILAGDYLASKEAAGSFEGCLESAEACAHATCCLLFGENGDSDFSATTVPDVPPAGSSKSRSGRWRSTVANATELGSVNEGDGSQKRRWVRKVAE